MKLATAIMYNRGVASSSAIIGMTWYIFSNYVTYDPSDYSRPKVVQKTLCSETIFTNTFTTREARKFTQTVLESTCVDFPETLDIHFVR